MQERNLSDETPVADAVEQNQETAPEPAAGYQAEPPIEANASDWHEQLQEVVSADDDDRDEYRQ